MAVVDLERAHYQVTEGNTVQVCAVVRTPNITCPVAFSFDINLAVGEGIAMMRVMIMLGIVALFIMAAIINECSSNFSLRYLIQFHSQVMFVVLCQTGLSTHALLYPSHFQYMLSLLICMHMW